MKKNTISKKKRAKRKFIPAKKKTTTIEKPTSSEPESFEEAEAEFITTGEIEILRKYPSPPGKGKVFIARWRECILDVALRENFKRGHLATLEILCDLFVEYEILSDNIRENGYTYYAQTRNGDQWKQRAEVIQLNRTRSEIRSYSKTLGLLLVKDKELNDGKDEAKEWD